MCGVVAFDVEASREGRREGGREEVAWGVWHYISDDSWSL
jgi:hypothetical protein